MQLIERYILAASLIAIVCSALAHAEPAMPLPGSHQLASVEPITPLSEQYQESDISSLSSLSEGLNDIKVGIVCARGRQKRISYNGTYLARYLGYAVVRFEGYTDERVLIVSPEEQYPRTGNPSNHWKRGRATRDAAIQLNRKSLHRALKYGKPYPTAQKITVWKHGPDLYLAQVDDYVLFNDIKELELDVLYEELDVASVGN